MKLIDYMSKMGLTERQVADQIGTTQCRVNRLKLRKVWPCDKIARAILDWSQGMVTPTDMFPERTEK